jgi:hypothetical protein
MFLVLIVREMTKHQLEQFPFGGAVAIEPRRLRNIVIDVENAPGGDWIEISQEHGGRGRFSNMDYIPMVMRELRSSSMRQHNRGADVFA